jgi:alkaline phosphatase
VNPHHSILRRGVEFDAVGAAREWASDRNDTLILVTADHDQSMTIVGVNNVPDVEYFDRGKKVDFSITSARGEHGFTAFGDSYADTRASLPFINFSDSTANRRGVNGMPGSFTDTTSAANPSADTFSTYAGSPADTKDAATGYPSNTALPGQILRRLDVAFRTGDHTGSSVPVTAEGPGAFLLTGYMDQTDTFFKTAIALSGDIEEGDAFLRFFLRKYRLTIGK